MNMYKRLEHAVEAQTAAYTKLEGLTIPPGEVPADVGNWEQYIRYLRFGESPTETSLYQLLEWLRLLNDELQIRVFEMGQGQEARLILRQVNRVLDSFGPPYNELLMESPAYCAILKKTHLLCESQMEALRYSFRLSVLLPEKQRVKNQCERIKEATDWNLCRMQEATHIYNSALARESFTEENVPPKGLFEKNLLCASGLALAVLDCLLLDLEQGQMNKANEFTWVSALINSAFHVEKMLESGGDWREILPVPAAHVARSMDEKPKTYKRLVGVLSFISQLKKYPEGMQLFEKLKRDDEERQKNKPDVEKKHAKDTKEWTTQGIQPPEEVKIFLSSSFLDMHAERDFLQINVFPKLDLYLRLHNRKLKVIDLRGTEQDCAKEDHQREVFAMCLNQVDDCRPRMVGLVGNRYGWAPFDPDAKEKPTLSMRYMAKRIAFEHGLRLDDIAKKSVTHMEIEHGLRIMEKDKCFFFFRQLTPEEKPVPKEDEVYKFSAEDKGIPMLRRELMRTYGVSRIAPAKEPGYHLQSYDASFRDGHVRDLSAFGDLVYRNLSNNFTFVSGRKKSFTEKLFGFSTDVLPVWYTRLSSYLDEKAQETVPMPQAEQIAQWSLAEKPAIIRIDGATGCGKSVLLAQTFARLQAAKDCLVLPFVASLEPKTETMDMICTYWIEMLSHLFGIPKWRMEQADDKEDYFLRLVHTLAGKKRIVLLIDDMSGIDNFTIRVTTSMSLVCCGGNRLSAVDSHTMEQVTLSPPEDLSPYLDAISRRYGKKLNPEISARVLESARKAENNLLYLQLLVAYLTRMDSDDFSSFRGEDAHLQWMRREIEAMPDTCRGVSEFILKRAERHFSAGLIQGIRERLSIIPYGIISSDLLDMLFTAGAVPKSRRNDKAFRQDISKELFGIHSELGPLLLFDVMQQNWVPGHKDIL